jgi:hypothetical protein
MRKPTKQPPKHPLYHYSQMQDWHSLTTTSGVDPAFLKHAFEASDGQQKSVFDAMLGIECDVGREGPRWICTIFERRTTRQWQLLNHHHHLVGCFQSCRGMLFRPNLADVCSCARLRPSSQQLSHVQCRVGKRGGDDTADGVVGSQILRRS